jgi:hypothetical protein
MQNDDTQADGYYGEEEMNQEDLDLTFLDEEETKQDTDKSKK